MAKTEGEEKKNTTQDLRQHLFDQIERLNNPELDLKQELERAKALANIGNVIVGSVKAEIDFMKVTGAKPVTGDKKKIGNG